MLAMKVEVSTSRCLLPALTVVNYRMLALFSKAYCWMLAMKEDVSTSRCLLPARAPSRLDTCS